MPTPFVREPGIKEVSVKHRRMDVGGCDRLDIGPVAGCDYRIAGQGVSDFSTYGTILGE